MAESQPFRVDQVGSLLRPPQLLAARVDYGVGRIDRTELRAVEDGAIVAVVRKQEAVGLDVLTDGEYRRTTYLHGFFDAVEGWEEDAVALPFTSPSGETVPGPLPGVVGRLRKLGNPARDDAHFLRQHTTRPIKVTLPGASLIGTHVQRERAAQAYPDRAELRADIARLTRELVEELVADGVPYIQLDVPNYTVFCDPRWRAYHAEKGRNLDAMLAQDLAMDNAVVAGLAGRAAFGLHLCRGNYQNNWFSQGGYEPLAERVFQQTAYDRLLLEYDSDRAGDFSPLRFVPPDKTVVLGLVSSKSSRVETEVELLERIEEAARYIPVERLALSPQCGFASGAWGNLLSHEDQWAKFAVLVRVAREVWG